MILVWNDPKSFKRHLEDMRIFRRSHNDNPENIMTSLKDMPTLCEIHPENNRGKINIRASSGVKMIFVPIWKIELPRDSQN